MTTRKYRYCKETGKVVEAGKENPSAPKGPYIIGDIEPYQAVGPEYGTWITSRSKHREYLRRHNLIEVGDQKAYVTGEKK